MSESLTAPCDECRAGINEPCGVLCEHAQQPVPPEETLLDATLQPGIH